MTAAGSDPFGGGELFGDRLFTALDKREPAPGMLLVSAPDMGDPNFARTVVYLVQHDHGGTLGVVLTRPSDTPVGDVLPAWAPLMSVPGTFFLGGPVQLDTGIALVVLRPGVDGEAVAGTQRVEGRVRVVDLDADPDDLRDVVAGMRVFVGHAGWAPGQLQAELDRGDWYVAPSLPEDLVSPARVDVWARVLARQEMPLPLYSTYVADGSVN